MLAAIDLFARRIVAWPLALIGLALSFVSEGLIYAAAWLVGIDPSDDNSYL